MNKNFKLIIPLLWLSCLFLFTQLPLISSENDCLENGWISIKESGTCISIISNVNKNFYESLAYCSSLNSTLATLLTLEDQLDLTNLMENSNVSKLWIGLNNHFGEFYWLSGLPWKKSSFNNDITSTNDSSSCVSFSVKNEMTSESCFTPLHAFACERRPIPIEQNIVIKSGSCPDKFFRVDNYCYFVYSDNKKGLPMSKAEEHCQRLSTNGKLATIHDIRVQNFFTAFMGTLSWEAYIGLNYLNGLNYSWSRGDNVSFTHWLPSFPISSSFKNACVLMNHQLDSTTGMWKNVPCSHPQDFICEANLIEEKNEEDNLNVTLSAPSADLLDWQKLRKLQFDNRLFNRQGPCSFLNISKEQEKNGIVFEYHSHCYYFDLNKLTSNITDAQQHCQSWSTNATLVLSNNVRTNAILRRLLTIVTSSYSATSENQNQDQTNDLYNSIWLALKVKPTVKGKSIVEDGEMFQEELGDILVYPSLKAGLDHLLNETYEDLCFVVSLSEMALLPVKCFGTVLRHVACSYSLTIPTNNPTAIETKIQCPQSFTNGPVYKWNTYCFYLPPTPPLKFYYSSKTCVRSHASPVEIHSVQMQRAVFKMLNNSKYDIWMNAKFYGNNPNDLSMKWFGGQLNDEPTYWHYAYGYPKYFSSDNQNCLVMNKTTGQWFTAPCSKSSFGTMCMAKGVVKQQITTSVSTTEQVSSSPSTTTTTTATTKTASVKSTTAGTKIETIRCHNASHTLLNGTCYFIIESLLTWEEADHSCRREFSNSYLVSIHDSSANQLVNNLLNKSELSRGWIGLSQLYTLHMDSFTKWSDDSPLDYIDFLFDKKEMSLNDCIVYNTKERRTNEEDGGSGSWSFRNCNTKSVAICSYNMVEKTYSHPIHASHGFVLNETACLNGFKSDDRNQCIKIVTDEPKTWDEANEYCKSLVPSHYHLAASLLTMERDAENLFVYSLLEEVLYDENWNLRKSFREDNNFWIGYEFIDHDVYRIDNYSVSYSHWSSKAFSFQGKKNHRVCAAFSGDSLSSRGGMWLGRACDEKRAFICQSSRIRIDHLSSNQYSLPHTPCAQGFHSFHRPQGFSCYTLLSGFHSWLEASEACKIHHPEKSIASTMNIVTPTHLLSLTSAYELAYIRSFLYNLGASADRPIWLGLQIINSQDSDWRWNSSLNLPVTFTLKFDSEKLTSKKQKCFSFLLAGLEKMEIGDCVLPRKEGYYSICKYDIDPPPLQSSCSGPQQTKDGQKCVRWDTISNLSIRESEFTLLTRDRSLGLINGLSTSTNVCQQPPLTSLTSSKSSRLPYCYIYNKNDEKYEKYYCSVYNCEAQSSYDHTMPPSYASVTIIALFVFGISFIVIVAVAFVWLRVKRSQNFLFSRLAPTRNDESLGTAFYNPMYTPAQC